MGGVDGAMFVEEVIALVWVAGWSFQVLHIIFSCSLVFKTVGDKLWEMRDKAGFRFTFACVVKVV